MIWTGWNNGEHHDSGAGYGFKLSAADRDRYFDRTWRAVIIELPVENGFVTAEANIAKASFWNEECREIINKNIGQWMRSEGYAPWPEGRPPEFDVETTAERRFKVKGLHGQG